MKKSLLLKGLFVAAMLCVSVAANADTFYRTFHVVAKNMTGNGSVYITTQPDESHSEYAKFDTNLESGFKCTMSGGYGRLFFYVNPDNGYAFQGVKVFLVDQDANEPSADEIEAAPFAEYKDGETDVENGVYSVVIFPGDSQGETDEEKGAWSPYGVYGSKNDYAAAAATPCNPYPDAYIYYYFAARVFNIIGLGNDWTTDHQMTRSSEDGEENIYTFTTTMNVFGGEADEYFEYKLRENSDWNGYQLPAQGDGNKSWKDQVNGIGTYTLTFTADIANNTLECKAVKSDFTYVVVGSKKVSGTDEDSPLFDGNWNTATTTDVLTKGSDGKFTLTKEVALEAQYVEFKAYTKVGDTELWFGNGNGTENANYNFTSDGTYYVTFTFDGSTISATAEQKHVWTVAGSDVDLFGTAWAADATDNDMTRNDEGIWTITYKNKTLTAGTIEYKIVQDHAWTTSYGDNANPSENATATIPADGEYNVTFTFNADTKATACEIVPTTVPKKITDAGYATYYSPYALDFSSTGLTAYIAKLNGSEVSFTEVTKVPANTGVLLKGAAGDYNISTTLDATDDVTGNVLKGVLADTEVAVGSFVLLKGDKGVGFYKTTATFTVGANTAYFEALPTTARFIGFDDMTTTINNVDANLNANGQIYDLQGRRVVAPQKGLYIINGKKVVLK